MNLAVSARALSLAFLFIPAAAFSDEAPAYQKGTVTPSADKHKLYDLKGPDKTYQIKDCGDFQSGESVDFHFSEGRVVVRRENGKEEHCKASVAVVPPPEAKPTYQKGTIGSWSVRIDSTTGGGANGGVWTSKRRTKVYELKGADYVYHIDSCGAFQAGKFTIGQIVDYRVDGERLYIVHDGNKEYSCKIDGQMPLTKPDASR